MDSFVSANGATKLDPGDSSVVPFDGTSVDTTVAGVAAQDGGVGSAVGDLGLAASVDSEDMALASAVATNRFLVIAPSHTAGSVSGSATGGSAAVAIGGGIADDGGSGASGFGNAGILSNYSKVTTTSSVTYGHITFNNTYTSSANANTSYKNSILAAEQSLGSLFSNTITLNLTFDAQAAGNSGYLAFNSWSSWVTVSYATLKTALTSHASGDSFLTSSDPSGGAGWYLPEAYARMLGLSSTAPSTDDTITLNTSYNWSYGQDALNTIMHEISEGGMGRVGGLGHQNGVWSTMDLFRYSSANTPYYTWNTTNTYFSANGSNLSSIPYDTSSTGGDTADFYALDVFGYGYAGETDTISTTDIRVMNALGWTSNRQGTATNDFYGRGKSDVLWENGTSTWIWEMDGTTVIGGGSATGTGAPGWSIAGIGDYNGDGKSDILWQNSSTGGAWIWEMSGQTVIGGGSAGTGGPGWSIVGTGGSGSATAAVAGGGPTASDATHTADLALLGQYAAAGFATAPDPGGGALVTYAAAQSSSGDPNWLTGPQY